MKLKELHIRNIASIEKADINFDKDLNDTITGIPASIFLISGDTGAGKSVILDGISMALYKKTPRITNVANSTKNDYTNRDGESIRVASIEQYTRLGISEKDDSYSEVVFEGNDGKNYHVRLILGMTLGNTDKSTGLRPLKHKSPKWEIKIGNGDWTKDSVEQTILDAVGLDFQQFGRMAMLAQGQFANFLTGDKKEREAILEQLTNTQHFTAYGEAIQSLYRKAKEKQTIVQTEYDVEKHHKMDDEEVEQVTNEKANNQKQKEALDVLIKTYEDKIKQVDLVLDNEKKQEESKQRKQELEAIIEGEEYKRKKALFSDWDATTEQRRQLTELQKARRDEQEARDGFVPLHNTFNKLSSDLVERQNQAAALEEQIRQNSKWIEEHQQHDALFTKAGEVDLKIGQYLETTKKVEKSETLLKDERAKTGNLKKVEKEAVNKVKEATKEVDAKKQEIDALVQERSKLNPQSVNEQIAQKESTKKILETIRLEYNTLESRKQEANDLRKNIKAEEITLKSLQEVKDKTETIYQAKRAESEKANSRLNTMRMSVNDTIVELRHRLHDEQTETCPLCGQPIDPTCLYDDFKGLLSPLEAEQKEAANALEQATRQRDEARDAFNSFQGTHQEKVKQLTTNDKNNASAQQTIEDKAVRVCLDIHQPLVAQIEQSLNQIALDLTKLKADQKEAVRLQEEIDRLHKALEPFETKKQEAENEKNKVENDVKANTDAIVRLENEHKEWIQAAKVLKTEITTQLAGYCDDWQADIELLRKKLKSDADEYTKHQKQLSDDKASQEKITTLIRALLRWQQVILHDCPKWEKTFEPQAYPCHDISTEWTTLLTKVAEVVSKYKNSKAIIDATTETLSVYYQASGKTEQALQSLMAQEFQVAEARKFVGDTDADLKSRNDAIADAQRQIDVAFKALEITNRCELSDKQQLEEEKASMTAQRDDYIGKIAQATSRLEDHKANVRRLQEIKKKLDVAEKNFARWDRLNSIFGGTRFRTLVQTYILRPLLNNANIYLEQITDRYRLTCSEDNEQLSILVLDRYNKDQVRSVTVLSGGERFMISLALSLALSSLNRSDMNVNILFIDEGFGTLDEKSLDSVICTLEKLQEIAGQTNRRVGIISHREELEERIPTKIKVVKKGEGRSLVEIVV